MIFLPRRPSVDYTIEKETRKTEHFQALTKGRRTSAIADHISSTGHNIKWNHFEILRTGKSNCRIKQTLLIRDLKSALNENVGRAKLFLYQHHILKFPADFKLSLSSSFVVISYCFYLFIRFHSFSRCLNFTVIFLTVTPEDVCCYKDYANLRNR